MECPFYPIVYVRGYAMTEDEINETTADPFCGFNLGSTVFRASTDRKGKARKFVFESPVVRLMTDFGYKDVFEDGLDIVDQGWNTPIQARSIIVHRYYDPSSTLLGTDKAPDIRDFATALSTLIATVRKWCMEGDRKVAESDFRCYLVAHSMGGLVCRAFLQNPAYDEEKVRGCVDKVFTYATPHNGIEMAGFNVPAWLKLYDMDTFNRDEMAKYLDLGFLPDREGRVDWLPAEDSKGGKLLGIDRFFCMIGTNRADYDVAKGLSRTFAGEGSDGLVKIANASVWAPAQNGSEDAVPAPRAYAYRSHSGFFGIVNSEEAYQNLIRFLFGDVRVDIWLDVETVQLPKPVQRAAAAGNTVNANVLFEAEAAPRGALWSLTRRRAEEDSPACRSYAELTGGEKSLSSIYLSSVFLGARWKVNMDRKSLAYGLDLAVRVPEYEVQHRLWLDDHYNGGALFQDTLVVEIDEQPTNAGWGVACSWLSGAAVVFPQGTNATPGKTTLPYAANGKLDKCPLRVSFGDPQKAPGISGTIRFLVSEWNACT